MNVDEQPTTAIAPALADPDIPARQDNGRARRCRPIGGTLAKATRTTIPCRRHLDRAVHFAPARLDQPALVYYEERGSGPGRTPSLDPQSDVRPQNSASLLGE